MLAFFVLILAINFLNEHFENIDDKVGDLEEKDVFIDIHAFNE